MGNLVGGSCENDRESMRTGAYTLDIVNSDFQISNCGFTNTDCEEDTCAIDLFYLKAISAFMEANPGHTATSVDAAGRKLNDSKEYIDFYVHNQLITFGWPNVKQFTFETIDDAVVYHVGWVERSRVDNFAPGGTDTLGDNTKGGVQTQGILSGDATIRMQDGLELPYNGNPAQDFFNAGTTVTCIKDSDNEEFQYWVNGVLIGSRSYSGWAGVYPAIDIL